MQLNTSRIAVDVFNTTSPTTSSSGSGIWGWVRNETNKVEGEIENVVNEDLDSFAKALGLHDFYSIHVLDFCEGFFQPNGTADRNVTYCSNATALFTFNATQTLQDELDKAGIDISLQDLHWPHAIQDGINTLKLSFKVVFVMYAIGIAATGLSLLGSAAGLFMEGHLIALLNILLAQLAFLCMLIASAIVTWAATKATNVINEYGKDIDVNATRGGGFIAITWVSTVALFIGSIGWVVELFVHKRKMKKMPKEYQ